jgi:hypothetical protein
VADSSLTPRAAMIQLIGTDADGEPKDPAKLRRLQSKWTKSGEALMSEARERAKPSAPQAPPMPVAPLASFLQAKQAFANSPQAEVV